MSVVVRNTPRTNADIVAEFEEPGVATVHEAQGRGGLRFLTLLRDHPQFWAKVTCPDRLTLSGPPAYGDVVPFARMVVEEFPDRVLWGTDWPHPNLKSHMPDDGALVDFIPRIAPMEQLRRRLLVDNPARLYWGQTA
jgi:2-pyrone-4,6-dicarboxylate lactonase